MSVFSYGRNRSSAKQQTVEASGGWGGLGGWGEELGGWLGVGGVGGGDECARPACCVWLVCLSVCLSIPSRICVVAWVCSSLKAINAEFTSAEKIGRHFFFFFFYTVEYKKATTPSPVHSALFA